MIKCTNQGNSSISLFDSHKWIERKKSGLQIKTAVNTSALRGNQRKNRKTEEQHKTKQQSNTHINEL